MPSRVLVTTTTYNSRPEWLRDMLASVASQRIRGVTHTIGDDGSSDPETLAALKELGDRVRYFPHRGCGRGLLNDLIEPHNDADYIAILDHDDVLTANSLAIRRDYLDAHPEVALVSGFGRCIDEHGKDLGHVMQYGGPYEETKPPPFDAAHGGWNAKVHWPPYHSGCMYRREWWDRVGGYRVKPARSPGDVGLFEDMLAVGAKFTLLPEVVVHQRVWHGSVSFRNSETRHRLLGIPWSPPSGRKKRDPQMSKRDRAWLESMGRHCRRIVEVGVYEGDGTARLAANGARVWSVDHWTDPHGTPRDKMYAHVTSRFASEIAKGSVTPLRMKSAAAAKHLMEVEGRTFDLVFIDADHSYEGVRDDIRAWRPLVRRGGILAGHDYHKRWPGVIKAVDEAFGRRIRRHAGTIWSIRL